MIYNLDIVYTVNSSIIALRNVEEIKFPDDPADQVVDVLKGDLHLVLGMISGKEHTVSMKLLKDRVGYRYADSAELRMAVYERWLFIVKEV